MIDRDIYPLPTGLKGLQCDNLKRTYSLVPLVGCTLKRDKSEDDYVGVMTPDGVITADMVNDKFVIRYIALNGYAIRAAIDELGQVHRSGRMGTITLAEWEKENHVRPTGCAHE